MTAFNWAGLAARIRDMQSYNEAADYLRTRIEAAFVPAWQHKATCIGYSLDVEEATARAEAAEARVKALEELISELSDDLEAEVQDRWGYDDRLSHKLKRDMDVVVRARQALGGEHE